MKKLILSRQLLYNLVDVTYGFAKEDESVPSTKAARALIKKAIERTRVSKYKSPLKASYEMTSLDKELDKYFSLYIRKRFANQYGMVRCPCCGAPIKWQQSVCAHYIRRGNMATRWHEHNALPACDECNSSANENRLKKAIGYRLDELFGPGTAQSIDELSRTTVKMFPHEKQDLLNDLKEKLKAL